jgi:cytoskeletal protein RodZ
MPTLGEYFKQEREKRGISLKDIEKQTKISAQTLKFLEEGRFDVLPPKTFLKGFLRVIAKEYGMDERELVRLLERALGPNNREEEPRPSLEKNARIKRFIVLGIGILLLLLLIAGGLALCSTEQKENSKTATASQDIK